MTEKGQDLTSFAKPPEVSKIQTGESTPLLEGNKKSVFLEDYLRASKEVDKKYPGHYEATKKFAEV